MTCKVLSSGVTKGQVHERTGPRTIVDPTRSHDPAGFWNGYELRLLDADGRVVQATCVTGIDGGRSSLTTRDELQTAVGPGTTYELLSGEDAPVAAVRYLLGLPLEQPIPPVDVRLGTTRGTNALLPESVAVLWAAEMPGAFHARYSAHARTYRYVLLNRAARPALAARYAGWCHAPLDVEAMRAAARLLVGEHDFSAFRSAECQAQSPRRTLHALEISAQGERIDFVLRANAFLHHMVRNLVGLLVTVGRGKHPPAWAGEVLASRDRARGAPTFAAEGLYLERVEYAPHWGVPTFAAEGAGRVPALP